MNACSAVQIKVEQHLGLVHSCCQRFRSRGIEYDDIFQSGCMGLMKAAKKFDASRGIKFSTYAVPVILGEIKALFRDNGSIKVSRGLKELASKVHFERERFLNFFEREPTISELSEALDITNDEVLEALDSSKIPISLDAPAGEENDTTTEIPVMFEDEKISFRISIHKVLNTFEVRDKNLIYFRFFKGSTQSETAKKLGMTQVQVSRREKILLKFLREKLA